jgi:hypothetical protein
MHAPLKAQRRPKGHLQQSEGEPVNRLRRAVGSS